MNQDLFVALRRALAVRLLFSLKHFFGGLGSWRDPDANRFLEQAVPLVQGSQRTLGTLTAQHVAFQASQALDRVIPPAAIPDARVVNLRPAQEVYRRPFVTVYKSLAKGDDITAAVSKGQTRLAEVAEADLQQTYAQASQAAMEALPKSAAPSGWRRALQGPTNCPKCVVASTQLFSVGTLNPLHPNCVPGASLVRVRNVLGATRSLYSGKLVTLTSARGQQVAVTPNHPVLTDRGWVAGSLVRPGDYLVYSGVEHRMTGRGPYEGDAPALAEDVWRSLAMAFGFHQMPLAPEDFHGDGSEGEVDIVWTNGYFSSVRDSESGHSPGERLLVAGHRGRGQFTGPGSAAPFIPGDRSAANGIVGRNGLGAALLDGHLCRPHAPSVRSTASWDLRLSEPALYDIARHPLLVREDVLGESVLDVVDAELLDRVTDVGRIDFLDHVYNFQTEFGTYETAGHIVHNCDCTVDPVFGDPGLVTDSPEVKAAVAALTGKPDVSPAELRRLVSSMVAEHGELGPMLVRPFDHFTAQGDLPS